MGKKSKPRAGSKAYYPRKRAKSIVAKFKTFKPNTGLKLLNFYGYKAGMLHVMATNKHKGSPLQGQTVSIPATIIEFPPLTVFGVKFYSKKGLALNPLKEFLFYDKADKELSRTIKSAGTAKIKGDTLKRANEFFEENKEQIVDIRLVTHTNPKLTTIGKKKPEVLELTLSGANEDKLNFFKEKLGKGLLIEDAFKENEYLDSKGVTIGRGFSGVIKRHNVKRRSHKAEKGQRRVGSIGPWNPSLVMWTVPRPGQHGFHTRTSYNNKLLKIVTPEEVDHKSGWEGYGAIRNQSMIIAGSVPGPVKRLITFRDSMRPLKDIKHDIESVEKIIL